MRLTRAPRKFGEPPRGWACWWQLVAGPGPLLIRVLVWSQRNAAREAGEAEPAKATLAYCPKVGYGPPVLENGDEIG